MSIDAETQNLVNSIRELCRAEHNKNLMDRFEKYLDQHEGIKADNVIDVISFLEAVLEDEGHSIYIDGENLVVDPDTSLTSHCKIKVYTDEAGAVTCQVSMKHPLRPEHVETKKAVVLSDDTYNILEPLEEFNLTERMVPFFNSSSMRAAVEEMMEAFLAA